MSVCKRTVRATIVTLAAFVLAGITCKAGGDPTPDQLRICAEIKKGNSANFKEVKIGADQTMRSIKLMDGSEFQGKIIKYEGITVQVQKPDGGVISIPGSILSDDEILSVFPNTMLGNMIKNDQSVETINKSLSAISEAANKMDAKDKVQTLLIGVLQAENKKLKEENEKLGRVNLSPATLGKWTEVARFAPSGDTNTAPFEIKTKEWRVRWKATRAISIYVYRPGEKAYTETFKSGDAGEVAEGMVYTGPGRYYLSTIGARGGWSAVVEELR